MISLRNASIEYALGGATVRALDGVDLDIAQGEFVAVIGASGSGKTTLMNVMGLMATPTGGSVMVAGADASALDEDGAAALRNKSLGFIFQHFHLLPRLTVLENVLLPSTYAEGRGPGRVEWEAHARKLLARLGLSGQEGKHPTLLSGGQKQRVAIARALLLDPDVLLADEPTGALDSVNTERVLDILEDLNASGKTIVVITHDAQVAARAKRIVRMKDGRVESDAPNPAYRERATIGAGREARSDAASDTFTASDREGNGSVTKGMAAVLASLPRGTSVRHAAANLGANPVRAVLTVFGLAIGVGAIIIMLTLTDEARSAFRRFFDTKGGNSATVGYDWREAERLGRERWRGLHREAELPALNAFFSRYGRIDPRAEESGCQFRSRWRSGSGDVNGVDALAQFTEAERKLAKGRFFTPAEVGGAPGEGATKVAILGKAAAESLFPRDAEAAASNPRYPVGDLLAIRGGCPIDLTLTVVGVLEEQDSTFDDSINGAVWTPTRTLRDAGVSAFSRYLSVVPEPGVSPTWLAESVRNYLRVKTGDRYPFRTFVPEQQIARVNLMLTILGGLTVVVGGLCTVIGGIGVMNIMLVNIAERVREIGIRKAVGARASRIRDQFVVESVVLCLVAGFVGVAAGVLVCNVALGVAARLVPRYLEAHFVWNSTAVAVALVSSVAAGLGFGLLPARRAAQLDVVESLRQE